MGSLGENFVTCLSMVYKLKIKQKKNFEVFL